MALCTHAVRSGQGVKPSVSGVTHPFAPADLQSYALTSSPLIPSFVYIFDALFLSLCLRYSEPYVCEVTVWGRRGKWCLFSKYVLLTANTLCYY